MRLVVPLQGVVQGRGGLILGSLIPCALFYFLQFYLKRNRSPPSPSSSNPPSPSAAADSLPGSSSRSNLFARGGSKGNGAGLMSKVMGGKVSFDPSHVVLTSGATPAIEMLCFCLADLGNAFLIPTPY